MAVADSYSVSHTSVLTVTASNGVLANDSDADGDPVTAVLVSGVSPAQGTLTFNSDGSFTFTPAAGFLGNATFQYQTSDGVLSSSPVTVTLAVTDAAPLANADAYHVLHDTTLSLPGPGVLANASDPDGDPLTASAVAQPQHGVLSLASNGAVTYTPNPGYTGPDSFSYTASDGNMTSAPATVSLLVTASNSPPSASASIYTLNHDTTLGVGNSGGVLTNAFDPDGDPLTAQLVSAAANGTVQLAADGSFTYTPNAGYTGRDSFVFRVFDGTSYSPDATVTLSVTSATPITNTAAYSVSASGTTSVAAARGVLANDSAGTDAMTAVLVNGTSAGTISLNADGSFSYTPGPYFHYMGQDSFTYKVVTAFQQSSPVTVTLLANPVAASDSYTGNHDQPLTVTPRTGCWPTIRTPAATRWWRPSTPGLTPAA